MILKYFFTLLILLSFSIFFGCSTENRDNSRAYVEGKIIGNTIDFSKINITIKSENTNIAETIPNNSGDFILSGPLLSDSFTLVLNKKIKSFKSSKSGCTL